jgi:hypothetical protein
MTIFSVSRLYSLKAELKLFGIEVVQSEVTSLVYLLIANYYETLRIRS